MIRRRNFRTAFELQAEIDSWTSDEEDSNLGHKADNIDIVITPPDLIDDVSDLEEIDDNIQIVNDDNKLPNELAGQFEIEFNYDDGNVNLTTEPQSSKSKPKRRVTVGNNPKWIHDKNIVFDKQPVDHEKMDQKLLYEKIGKFCVIILAYKYQLCF